MTYDATREPGGPDLSSAAITGLTTLAWYAVPDLVRPRWGRAVAKAAVAAAGVGAGVAVTVEGRAARAGLREAFGAPEGPAGPGSPDHSAARDVPGGSAGDENGLPDLGDGSSGAVDARLVVAAVAGALGVGVALAVAGEKWAYRRGEKWRAKGLSLPHTRVGLILGAAAACLTLLEPARVAEDDRPAAP